jgi:phosphoglucosamine mutase
VFQGLADQRRTRNPRLTLVIGKDTRLSGYMLENSLAAGVMSLGANVLFTGPLPTPGVAYITRSLRADAGIVLSPSHNPCEDNGIKFFRYDGYKLDYAIRTAD